MRGAVEPEPQAVAKESRRLKESSSSRLNLNAKIPISPFMALKDDLDENSQMVLAPEAENIRSNCKAGDLKTYYQSDVYITDSYPASAQDGSSSASAPFLASQIPSTASGI